MISDGKGKRESRITDPEELGKLLELELAQKRAVWESAAARHRQIRTLGFLFLFLLVVGGFFLFFIALMRVNEQRAKRPSPAATQSP